MPTIEEMKVAMATRALRNIRTELEFLTESSVITTEQMACIVSLLPDQNSLSVPAANPSNSTQLSPASSATLQPSPIVSAPAQPVPVPVPSFPSPAPQPVNSPMDEKRPSPYPSPQPAPPPPAYSYAAPLAYATALYAYNATDPGDLALLPNDRVAVIEYTNGDWWKGRSQRTGMEGIFPAKYVRPDDGAGAAPMQPPAPPSYGNMPLEVSQGGPPPPSAPATPGRIEAHGKRFGKKLGDAAIFGAGATIGSSIVHKIF